MKVMKLLTAVLCSILFGAMFLVSPIHAKSADMNDGLEITLTTDKESYAQGETIEATLSVSTKYVTIHNLSLEHVVPEGYHLEEGCETALHVDTLEPGSPVVIKVTYVPDPKNDSTSGSEPEKPTQTPGSEPEKPTQTPGSEPATKPGSNPTIKPDSNPNEKPGSGQAPDSNKDTALGPDRNTTSTPAATPANTSVPDGSVAKAQNHVDTVMTQSPTTGDPADAVVWIVLAATAVGISGIVLLKKKEILFCFLFCIILAGGFFFYSPVRARAEGSALKTQRVQTQIQVNHKSVTLTGNISYSPIESGYTRGEWIQTLIDAYGYKFDYNISESYFSDIAGTEYEEAINVAAAYKIIDSDENNRYFEPYAPVNREFAALTSVRIMGYIPDEKIECDDSNSIRFPSEAALSVKLGFFTLTDNRFCPYAPFTKAEGEAILNIMEQEQPSWPDNEDHEGLVFQEGVITLADTVQYEDDGTILKLPETSELSGLQPGDILVIGHSKVYKAVHITKEDTKLNITYEMPELSEVLQSMDLQGKAAFAEFKPEDGVAFNYNQDGIMTLSLGNFNENGSFQPGSGEFSTEGDVSLTDHWSVGYTIEAAFPEVRYQLKGSFLSNNLLDVKNAYIELPHNMSIAVHTQYELQAGSEDGIRLGEVTLIDADGLVQIVLDVHLVVSATGKFELKFTESGTLGFGIMNGAYKQDSSITTNFEMAAECTMKMGPSITAKIKLFEFFDLMDVTTDMGFQLKGSSVVRLDGTTCLDGRLNAYLEITAFKESEIAKALQTEPFTWTIWDEDNSYVKIDGHWEDGQRVTECTHKDDPSEPINNNSGGGIVGVGRFLQIDLSFPAPDLAGEFYGYLNSPGGGQGQGGAWSIIFPYMESIDDYIDGYLQGHAPGKVTVTWNDPNDHSKGGTLSMVIDLQYWASSEKNVTAHRMLIAPPTDTTLYGTINVQLYLDGKKVAEFKDYHSDESIGYASLFCFTYDFTTGAILVERDLFNNEKTIIIYGKPLTARSNSPDISILDDVVTVQTDTTEKTEEEPTTMETNVTEETDSVSGNHLHGTVSSPDPSQMPDNATIPLPAAG